MKAWILERSRSKDHEPETLLFVSDDATAFEDMQKKFPGYLVRALNAIASNAFSLHITIRQEVKPLNSNGFYTEKHNQTFFGIDFDVAIS